MKRTVILAFLFFFIAFLNGAQVHADNQKREGRYLSIPLLYMTDRAASKKGYTTQRKEEDGTSIYNLNCGTLEYTSEKPIHAPLNDLQIRLGWHRSNKRKRLPISIKLLPGSGTKNAYHDLGEAVLAASQKSGCKDVFVIVHGFNTGFAKAAASAAKLAYEVQCPVLIYDWPSKGRTMQYDVDDGNNEWSQEHFNHLLEELKAVKDRSGINFNLLAHSMGNRLAIRSVPVLMEQRHIFKDIFLVDPDIDAETFVHYLIRYGKIRDAEGSSDLRTNVRILFSHKDHALPFSELLFGGYTRLGQAADSMLSTIFTDSSIENMDEQTPDTGKQDTKADPRPDWLVKFQWIDYTMLDHGAFGHSIPYSLIANLWAEDEPGDGLALVESQNGALNSLSRFSLGLFHEKEHISARLGHCLKVEPAAKR